MAEITKLHKQRGLVKAQMTRLKTKVDQAEEHQISREEAEVYIARLEEIQREFQGIQYKITNITEGEPTVADVDEDAAFEDKYLETKIKLKRWVNAPVQQGEARASVGDETLTRVLLQQGELMQKLSLQQGGSQASSSNNDAITKLFEQQTQLMRSIAEASGVSNAESRIKLPVVKLPTFDGRTEEWKRFSETFLSMIHNNEDIPSIQKFQYLVTSLSGNAAKVVESIELTTENYEVAWELLKKRYDDPRAIKKRHIECLFTMPKVDKESANAIRSLVDYVMRHLRVLKSMNLPTDSWDELIIHMIEAKLDKVTLRAWEQGRSGTDTTLTALTEFLERRCQTLERIEARGKEENVSKPETNKHKPKVQERKTALTNVTAAGKCYLCQGDHLIYHCEKFLALTIDDRLKEVRQLKLCLNCLRNDHFVRTCKMGSCRECSGKHNTLCHRPARNKDTRGNEATTEQTSQDENDKKNKSVVVHHATRDSTKRHVLMATAVVNATHPNGSIISLRILLDSASEAHFITHAACNRLGVKRNRTTEIVTGLSETESVVNQVCEINLQSRYSNVRYNVRSLIVPKITKSLPCVELDRDALRIPPNVQLADPEFYKQGSVDMLIGAEFFFKWLEPGRIELGNDRPILQNTQLGWVIAGSFADNFASINGNSLPTTALICSIEHCDTLNKSLQQFWALEDYRCDTKPLSEEARECDVFFEETTSREANGRFIVRLPFRDDPRILGDSRDIACKRLAQLERRFKRDRTTHERYIEFMRDYLDAGHMSLVNASKPESEGPVIYLPHHCVIKDTSSTTKLRAVFDASSKTSSGKSLNDVLRVGTTSQGSLFEIVIRFRFYKVVLTGDIRQMYRQVLVHPADRDCQRILWRFSLYEPIEEFRLNTVTYGQASSAYLAIKCVTKLAEEAYSDFPKASQVLFEQTYVDDILAGADDCEEAIALRRQIETVLQRGGFTAHKWCSNREEVIESVPTHLRETTSSLRIDAKDTVKTLGLEWDPKSDLFQFPALEVEMATTKRCILSAISKIFDPLGLIGPMLTAAKLIMRQTWLMECDWDEPLPPPLATKWAIFRKDLNEARTVCVPRQVTPSETPSRIYLHGFCDASENAYGACLYVQTITNQGLILANLLCSKSRVAPTKLTSIPRLELCSAVLLAHLIVNVRRALRVSIEDVLAWSDSRVALHWIQGDVARWKPFVANRVMEINELLPAKHWRHVRGSENPADILSRGSTLQRLNDSEIWWKGPPWLHQELRLTIIEQQNDRTSDEVIELIQIEERRSTQGCTLVGYKHTVIQGLIDKLSTLTRLERVMAYCLRYINNLRRIPGERAVSRLTAAEIKNAHNHLIRHVQAIAFAEEIAAIKKTGELSSVSNILQLRPFLDHQRILRVGGRLQHSTWAFARKHPIVLPDKSKFTRLLFEREHQRLLHGGQLQLLTSIRERYWPVRGRDLARRVCRECIRCARVEPRELSQVMGALPRERVCSGRAFAATGVDFAGPIITLVNKGRGRRTNKSYVALFICLATKAIHLEAVSELTTAAFLATFRRFISRRGRPHTIFSDNATNFVGANRELREMYQFAKNQSEGTFGDSLASEGIEWRFIPPHSPHMGGLWEAGVKACKHHLRRVMGNALLTFEELSTVLAQIEACLNSRPLSPLSSDPMDLEPLTPAHLLIGGSMMSIPEYDLTDLRRHSLDRWQLVQKLLQDFWKRWAAEYVSGLQGRLKWKKEQANIRIGDLVVLRDENLPPLKWKLGRIVEVHAGQDGFVRVVSVRTTSGVLKRAIVKLCKLPTRSNEEKIREPNLVGGMLESKEGDVIDNDGARIADPITDLPTLARGATLSVS